VVDRLPDVRPRSVARAPLPLDVLGGLADYSGALALHYPLGDFVCAAVQRRDDDQLVIERCHQASSNGRPSSALPLAEITAATKEADIAALSEKLSVSGSSVDRVVAGVVHEVLRIDSKASGQLGVTVAVGSTRDVDAGACGPMAAAVLEALGAAIGVELDAPTAAMICQRVENLWLGVPVGVSIGAGAVMGEAGCVNGHQCDSNKPAGQIPVPEGVALIGLCSGVIHEKCVEKYKRARTATFMGRLLIDRIVQHDGAGQLRWDGFLSRISVSDYVGRFRDRIPTKLKGQEFLDRFGETGDPLTQIEPSFAYKIRSRTEHHVYEHSRSRQFVEGLSRFARSRDRAVLGEIGELMYASHWSYGQRCGLGSIQTDSLVTLIRQFGEPAGVHGARISGRGCGGVVAVLLDDSEGAMQAVRQACDAYHEKTGHIARVLYGSTSGSKVAGVRTL